MRAPLVLACLIALGAGHHAAAAAADAGAPARPRLGLVLSGGGARGIAHVGVLKVLERERIPVDVIAGTSMGAIIGGLYASGMSAAEIERELLGLDWAAVFARRLPRETLDQRRKEEDFEISPAIEIGLSRQDGSPMLPIGSVSSRGLELLLRRYSLPVRQVRDFDALPIPFRVVATDMETGQAVVLREGDLAQALRASMSVPGLFPPTEVGGRILGDGGLVDNLPVGVAREMGAQAVIAVNIGTPLAPRETLGTVVGLTAQMINILTEQNVQRSLATLDARHDLLIAPDLGRLTSGDFAQAREFIARGEAQAQALIEGLRPWALTPEAWAVWRAAHQPSGEPPAPIVSVRFEGTEISHPAHFAGILSSRPGQPFQIERAEQDTRTLAASGDYLHADYAVEDLPAGTGLVFNLEEKPWGPHYFSLGLDLFSDFSGRGEFNVKLSHNRHWLNTDGGEWRNRLQLGSVPRWTTEWFQPLGPQRGPASDWFLSLAGDVEVRRMTAYTPVAPEDDASHPSTLARYVRRRLQLAAQLGQPWGRWGDARLGPVYELQRIDPDIIAGSDSIAEGSVTLRSHEWGLRAVVVFDQLDDAAFPRRGWRLRAQALSGRRWEDSTSSDGTWARFHRLEVDAQGALSAGAHALDASVRLRMAWQPSVYGLGQYSLGGFQNLSGYKPDQLSGNLVALGKLAYTLRLNQQPVLTRGFFAGATLEAGNAWTRANQFAANELRWGGSVFLAADTGLGPLYLGLTWAPLGATGLYLQLGKP